MTRRGGASTSSSFSSEEDFEATRIERLIAGEYLPGDKVRHVAHSTPGVVMWKLFDSTRYLVKPLSESAANFVADFAELELMRWTFPKTR